MKKRKLGILFVHLQPFYIIWRFRICPEYNFTVHCDDQTVFCKLAVLREFFFMELPI